MTDSIAEVAAKMHPTAKRLTMHLGNRWIMGTGFCHRSVGTELIELGIAESRVRHGRCEIRATPLGLAVRTHLMGQAS